MGGVPWGMAVGAVVLLVAGAAGPRGLMGGAGDGEALNGRLVRGLVPRVIRPPKNAFPLRDALQPAPGALQLHPPLSLPVKEAQFPTAGP